MGDLVLRQVNQDGGIKEVNNLMPIYRRALASIVSSILRKIAVLYKARPGIDQEIQAKGADCGNAILSA
jgi:hypothetical protein